MTSNASRDDQIKYHQFNQPTSQQTSLNRIEPDHVESHRIEPNQRSNPIQPNQPNEIKSNQAELNRIKLNQVT